MINNISSPVAAYAKSSIATAVIMASSLVITGILILCTFVFYVMGCVGLEPTTDGLRGHCSTN